MEREPSSSLSCVWAMRLLFSILLRRLMLELSIFIDWEKKCEL